jgi:hypothetical protein
VISILGAVGFEYGAVKQGVDRVPGALDASSPGQRRTRVPEMPCETVANAICSRIAPPVRLLGWSFLSGRGADIVGRDGQLGRLTDGMVARFAAVGTPLPRARLEFAAMIALASIIGWAVLGDAMDRAFGRPAPVELATLRTELQRMLRTYVAVS